MAEAVERAPIWKRVIAAILDFFTIFAVGGYAIAYFTGAITDNGFNLKNGPALALFALVVAYFVIGRRFAGGTLWDRILQIKRPQPA
jgi:uncharacterized RDD family membrane protein YckC